MLTRSMLVGVLLLIGVIGCATTPQVADSEEQRQMLMLLMPREIEIVEPFTRVTSSHDDPIPDGIEVLIQAVNSIGHGGLMMAGDLLVELYEYVPASAQHRGRRLQHWEVPLTNRTEQLRHWNDITQMYELLLRIDPEPIELAERYVLAVTYNSPLGEHLTDECYVSHQASTGPLGTALRE